MSVVIISFLVSVSTLIAYDYYKDNEAYEKELHKLLYDNGYYPKSIREHKDLNKNE